MKLIQLVISSILLVVYLEKVSGFTNDVNFCEDDSWVAFKDEKCVKLFDKFVIHSEALGTCQEFEGGLLAINSAEEQNFLSKLIFQDNQILENVWIGAIRKEQTDNSSQVEFEWDDHTQLRYTNWADGSPSGDLEKNCTQMKSHLGKERKDISTTELGIQLEDGVWVDTSCIQRCLVVCQKNQNWSVSELAKSFIQLRYRLTELENENAELTAQVEASNLGGDVGTITNCMQVQTPEKYPEALSSRFVLRNTKYTIYPLGLDEPKQVQCDFETDGGGWTVIQQRSSGPHDEFYLGWDSYEDGFGDVDGNYWIGLKTIHALTNGDSPQELRIELEDWEGNIRYAKYSSFSIEDSDQLYKLNVSGYSGNANDSLTGHSGYNFSTYDRDNDNSTENCAVTNHGAWWFSNCALSDLNGGYFEGGYGLEVRNGIEWQLWKGDYYSFKRTVMKIRDVTSF